MLSITSFLAKVISQTLSRIYPDLGAPKDFVEVAPCARPELGHYQSNIALKLAKLLKQPPISLANTLREHLPLEECAEKITVTPPGFLNITCNKSFLSNRLSQLLSDPKCLVSCAEKKRVIVEFSSPNIAKELHVGHLRSTIIGESLARLFTFQGHDVLRLNHIGDWGTQFGMLIAYIRAHVTENRWASAPSLEDLMHWYKKAKALFDEDEHFRKESQLAVVALQQGDTGSIEVWKDICAVSRKAYEEIYSLLDVSIQERGESFYNPHLAPMVEELEHRGMIEYSGGAKCIFPQGFKNREGNPLPFMVQKSDGGFNYDTTDLAALKHRVAVEKADRIIVITDSGQSLHFQLLFKAAEKVGYYDPEKVQMDHVTFGLVLGEDGKKFKTRSGETKKLVDLIYKAIEYASALVGEKSGHLSQEEKRHLAKTLGISAVKYADLSSQRQKDYTFSYARMLRFEGNTATFLLYAYVRMLGIERKIGKDLPSLLQTKPSLDHPSELALGLHLLRFAEVIDLITDNLEPHHLCDYLYKLAEKFHAFFRDCRVEGSDQEEGRLVLVEAARKVLAQGLYLLGIDTVERM
ncbi:MAG: arginine--tRNA ligase [Chlamydiota bacterium]